MVRLGAPARTVGLMLAVVLVAAACGSGSAASAGTGGGGGGSVPSGAAVGGSASGDISTVNACSLLTPAEIQQVLLVPIMAGANQDSDIVKQCEWDAQDNAPLTVGIVVRAFDPEQWQTLTEFPKAAAVSGLGEAAYKDSPLTGDLSVKYHGYEIDVAIVNFSTKSQAEIDQATMNLMKLALSRL